MLCTHHKEAPRSYNAPIESHMHDDESLKMKSILAIVIADLMRKFHGMQPPVLQVYNTLCHDVNLFQEAG